MGNTRLWIQLIASAQSILPNGYTTLFVIAIHLRYN